MLRRLKGPPFKNKAHGNLNFRECAEVWQGDLYSHEVRQLMAALCETGQFLRPDRKVLLLAENLPPQLAPAGAIDELRAIDGLSLEWEETYAPSRLTRIVEACIGGYVVRGDKAACYVVEAPAALASERLEFAHFLTLSIVSLPDTKAVSALVRQVRSERVLVDKLELDPSFALVTAWYDDRSQLYDAHERERLDHEMTTDFLCGRACSPAIRSAVSHFAASR